jgi:Big-like domain-containing protein
MKPVPRQIRLVSVLGSLAVLAACGGSDTSAPKKDVVPATLTAVSTDTIRGQVGGQGSVPLRVIVKNKAGEPIDSAVVTFAIATGNGTLGSPSVRTDATGQASTTWTLGGTAGVQTATATAGTLASVTFVAVAASGNPTSLTKVTGDLQSAAINTNVAIAPSVKVTDGFGNPVSGQQVTFTVGSGGGSVLGGTVTTNAAGTAAVGSWRLGATIGANTLVATVGSLTATFTATATVGAAANITVTPTNLGELLIGDTKQLTPRVVDAGGNVLANATVTYSTSSATVATVTPGGLVTATGAGTAIITATSGPASASVPLTVTGHPIGLTITSRDTTSFIAPGDIVFTNSAMLVGLGGQLKIQVLDLTGTTQTNLITVTSPAQTVLAPSKAAGPAILVSPGFVSRLWFLDPTAPKPVDSLDINAVITTATMTADGSRIYSMLDDGSLSVVDGAAHTAIARVTLGGGVTKLFIAPGDSTLYALTSVGIIFDVDLRTNTVRRQIIANVSGNDIAMGRDGLLYVLDGTNSLVSVFDIGTLSTLRTVGVAPGASTIAITPDGKQIWLTHTQGSVTVYQGSVANGFVSAGTISTNLSPPMRVFFSPNGSFAAVTNLGGWVDFIR